MIFKALNALFLYYNGDYHSSAFSLYRLLSFRADGMILIS